MCLNRYPYGRACVLHGTKSDAADSVHHGSFTDVSGFKKCVKREWGNKLQYVDPSDLRVYKSEHERLNGHPLEVDHDMGGISSSLPDPIIVVAPAASAAAPAGV